MIHKALLSMALICSLGMFACKPEGKEDQAATTSATAAPAAKQTPQEVAKAFFDDYFVKRDIAGAYQYFSQADKQVKTEAQYVQEKTQPNFEELYKKFNSYTIKSSEVGENKATFTAQIKVVDVAQLFKEAMGGKSLLDLAALKPEEASKLAEQNLAKYKDGKTPPPMMEQSAPIQLIQENGEWRVAVGWAEEAKAKQAQSPTLKIGQQGVLMSDPEKGNIVLKVNAVKFNAPKAKAGMVHCIVNIAVTNQMKGQFTELLVGALVSAEIYAQGGNKYKRDLALFAPELAKEVDVMNPLNPGKSVSGDLVFEIDKGAKDLTLTFDAGYSPVAAEKSMPGEKTLSFKLGNSSL